MAEYTRRCEVGFLSILKRTLCALHNSISLPFTTISSKSPDILKGYGSFYLFYVLDVTTALVLPLLVLSTSEHEHKFRTRFPTLTDIKTSLNHFRSQVYIVGTLTYTNTLWILFVLISPTCAYGNLTFQVNNSPVL